MQNRESTKDKINWVQNELKAYNPWEVEREYLNFILKRKFELDKNQQEKIIEWNDSEELYDVCYKEDEVSKNPVVNLGKEIEVVETKVADEVKAMPEVVIVAKSDKDRVKVKALMEVINYVNNKNQEELKKIETLYRKNIFWASIKKVFWKEVIRKVKVFTQLEEDENPKEEKEERLKWIERDKVEYKDIATKIIPLQNFRVNEWAKTIEEASEVIEIERFEFETAKQQFWHFSNFKFVKKWEWEKDSFDFIKNKCSFDKENLWEENKLNEDCLVFYYWNKPKDEYAIIANWILLTQYWNPNPYDHKELPYSRTICRFIPGSFWSKSDVQLIKSAKKQKNIIRNSVQKTVELTWVPIVKTVRSAGFDTQDFEVFPWAVWEFKDEKSAQATGVMQIHWDVSSALAYDAKLDEDITTLTWVDSRALLNTMTETATKTAVKKESALKRINTGLKLIEYEALYRETKLKIELIKQYYKEKEYFILAWEEKEQEPNIFWRYKQIPVKDKRFQWKDWEEWSEIDLIEWEETKWLVSDFEVKPELFDIDFEIEIRPASSIPYSESLEREKMSEIYQLATTNPFANQETAFREFLKSRDIDPEKENWITQPAPQIPWWWEIPPQ